MEEKGKEDKEKMMEDCYVFPKDNFVTRSTKKYPLASWMAVLALVMIVSVYIFLLCLKQKGIIGNSNIMKLSILERNLVMILAFHSLRFLMCIIRNPLLIISNQDNLAKIGSCCKRSGSGWFETLLNSHVNISSNGQIFSVKERRSNISSITKTLDKIFNLDWYSSAAKNECTAAVGLKWMLNQKLMDVLDFLRLPKHKLSSRHVKIHTRPLSDQVENWDVVYTTLNGTEYERFLHADYRM